MSQIRRLLFSIVFSLSVGVGHSSAASLALESGEWELASIPGDSGSYSVADVFVSDALPEEEYSSSWAIFTFDVQAGVYAEVPLDGSIETGEGFWIIQKTGVNVEVELDKLPMPAPASAGCTHVNGCHVVGLESRSSEASWNIAGIVSETARDVADISFFQDKSGAGCVSGCLAEEALSSGVFGPIWSYDSASGEYNRLDASSRILPGQGLWVRTAAGLSNPRMLIPANDEPDSGNPDESAPDEAENLALIKSNATRNTQFDDNAFYNVPIGDIAVSDLTVGYDAYNEVLLDTTNSGYFRVKCEVSHFAYDDPIVHPGQPGRAHLHMFFGNTEANAYSTFDSLLNTGTGTCNGEDLNRTAYWIPAMLDEQGNALIPDQIMVYYKNDNFRLNGANELVVPFPDNLRMISGNAGASSPQDGYTGAWQVQPVVSFTCGPAYGSDDRRQALIPDCFGSDQLEMQVAFPQCVDEAAGYQADQSHVSYSENGYYGARCPDSHATDISSIMYRIFFRPDEYGGSLTNLHLSSDIKRDRILPGGTTAHADWFGAWHPEAMRLWVNNCNNQQADCETGLLSRDPPISLVPRKRDFHSRGYRAPASELIKLCPGKSLDSADPLRSVAMCRMG